MRAPAPARPPPARQVSTTTTSEPVIRWEPPASPPRFEPVLSLGAPCGAVRGSTKRTLHTYKQQPTQHQQPKSQGKQECFSQHVHVSCYHGRTLRKGPGFPPTLPSILALTLGLSFPSSHSRANFSRAMPSRSSRTASRLPASTKDSMYRSSRRRALREAGRSLFTE